MPQAHSHDERAHDRPGRPRRARRRVYRLEELEPRVLLSGQTTDDSLAAQGASGLPVPPILTPGLARQFETSLEQLIAGVSGGGTATGDTTGAGSSGGTAADASSGIGSGNAAADGQGAANNAITSDSGQSGLVSQPSDLLVEAVSAVNRPEDQPIKRTPAASAAVVYSATQHSDLSSAQTLPDMDEVIVKGKIDTPNRSDFFQVTLNPHARGYQVELNAFAEQASSTDVKQLLLIDSHGEVVGNWVITRPTTDLVVDFRPSRPPAASQVFYLGVTGTSGSTDNPTPYEMRVSREVDSAPVSSVDSSPPPAATVDGPTSVSVRSDTTTEGPIASPSQGQSSTSDDTPIGLAQGTAVPVPLRMAGPPGGILSDADPTPLVDHRSAAVVDLALVDLMPELIDPAEADAEAAMAAAAEDAAEPIVLLRGPGGLPLMSAVRPGDDVPLAASTLASVGTNVAVPPDVVTTPAATDAESPRRRVHYHVGLCFTAIFSLTMLLPEISTAFDALRPRSRRRPLPRVRGVDFGPDEDRDTIPIR